jgi:hypothetical protein
LYDFTIFLCTDSAGDASCSNAATAGQIARLRSTLAADPDVAGLQYLSARNTYAIAQLDLPSSTARLLHVGDLPAQFWVDARDGAEQAALARYAKSRGVDEVLPCARTKDRCSVKLLRRAGVTH